MLLINYKFDLFNNKAIEKTFPILIRQILNNFPIESEL